MYEPTIKQLQQEVYDLQSRIIKQEELVKKYQDLLVGYLENKRNIIEADLNNIKNLITRDNLNDIPKNKFKRIFDNIEGDEVTF